MKSFSGVFTALITPFQEGQIDWLSFQKLVEFQLRNGVHGFVINGTTGECPNLSQEEVGSLYRAAREIVGDDFPIILGTGSNSTEKTVEMTRWACGLGANGALVVVPYYNSPTQEGLVQHYKRVAFANSKFPIILYNVPSRTITSLEPTTIKRLCEEENIVGIKEASGDVRWAHQLFGLKKDFCVTSGDDFSFVDFVLQGGDGVISVFSHILPKVAVDFYKRAQAKDQKASGDYTKYEELLKNLYCEPNPTGIKMALFYMGLIRSPELRLPLLSMSAENAEPLKKKMQGLGLL